MELKKLAFASFTLFTLSIIFFFLASTLITLVIRNELGLYALFVTGSLIVSLIFYLIVTKILKTEIKSTGTFVFDSFKIWLGTILLFILLYALLPFLFGVPDADCPRSISSDQIPSDSTRCSEARVLVSIFAIIGPHNPITVLLGVSLARRFFK